MNSDNIEARFGSYGVEIITQAENTRLANLYSEHEGARICRTLAMTCFLASPPEELAAAHQKILGGSSMGATLRREGWRVVKSDAAFAQCVAGMEFARLSHNTVAPDATLAVQLYKLQAVSASQRHDYAIVVEAYHPQHIPPSDTAPTLEALCSRLQGEAKQALEALGDVLVARPNQSAP